MPKSSKRRARGPATTRPANRQEIVRTGSYDLANPRGAGSPPLPVFLHSGFRTSSTWLWTQIRKLPDVLAYYEIFNETLATIDEKSIAGTTYSTRDLHHPAQAPYFLEYFPLIKKGGGVIGFDASMALERFIPEGGLHGELSLEEQAYLNILLEHAYRGRKVPLLSCTRSIGRMAAIKRFMPVHNVLLHRNIFDQWSSYSGQYLRGNRYFLYTIEQTAPSFKNDPFLNGLNEMFVVREPSPKDDQTFTFFILMHIYLYAQSIDSADVVIDTTALATDLALRHQAEDQLSRLVLAPVDLSDAKSNFDCSIVLVRDRARFIDTIEQFVKIIASTCSSEKAAAFAFKLKDDTLAQWDLHDSLTRNSTIWYERLTNDLQQQNDEQGRAHAAIETTAATVVGERDDAFVAISTIEAARDMAEAAVASVTHERDSMALTLAETSAARDAADTDVAELKAERDRIAASLADSDAASARADQLVTTLTAERDQIAVRLAETDAGRIAADTALAAMTAERDRVAAALTETLAFRDLAEEAAAALVAKRDGIAADLAKTIDAKAASDETAVALETERDRIAATLAETTAAKNAADDTVAELHAERDRIAATLAETTAAKNAADDTVAELRAERDRIAATLAETTAAKHAADDTVARLEAERDRTAATLAEITAAKGAADHAVTDLEAERDRIGSAFAETTAAKADAEKNVADLDAECGRLAATLAETAAAKAVADDSIAALEAERDRIAAESTEISAAKAAADETVAALESDRERISTELTEVTGARDAALDRIATVTDERDHLAATLAEWEAARLAAEQARTARSSPLRRLWPN